YNFNEAAGAAYQFVWHAFCDWYLEAAKPALYAEDRPAAREAARQTLWTVLREILVVLHPFAPFITEEIWEKLPGTDGSIMRAAFPQPQSTAGENATQDEVRMNLIMETITAIRTIRGEMNIPPAAKLYVTAQAPQEEVRQTLTTHQDLVVNLARLEHLGIEVQGKRSPTAATAIVGDTVLLVELKGVIDFAQERQRLEKEIGKLNKDLSAINNKLNNDSFLGKAPPEVVAEVREKQTLLSDKQHKLTATLERIRALDQQ
ncbi:MAG: class I tRNA ligase family protein, partial [Desulfobacterales bacterium]|nr:class I tRNA ligase family protein [Desulfobacterales bacterium]